MTSFNPDMVEGFDELAQDLKPEKDFMRAVRRTYGSIFKLLTEGAKYHDIKIDRTIVAGSIGKGTCISYTYEDDDGDDIVKNPDVDIVAFVNDEGPPFDEVLEAFKEILEDDSSISHLRITNISVQFDYYDWDSGITIPIDLLPGRNYVKSSELGWRTTACLQAEMAQKKLWKIHKNAIKTEKKLNLEENKLHSTGFCEKSVQVISCHVKDDFVASVVRLAKYWSTGVDLTGYGFLASRSCIIEMIAIDAQVGAGRGCLISGFKRFLESVANFRNLYINFHPKNNNNNNNKDSPKKGGRMPMPFIIDPANKFNNLAHGITPEQVQVFEGQAKKTLKMLQELRRRKAYVLVENPIDDIFSHKW